MFYLVVYFTKKGDFNVNSAILCYLVLFSAITI
jgi:hypothetical protein